MERIVIIGSGAVAAELTSFIDDFHSPANADRVIKGYIDFEENIDKYWKRYNFRNPVLGNIYSYKIEEGDVFVIGISDVPFRKKMVDIMIQRGGQFISLIHPTAIVARQTHLGVGNIINPHSIIGPNTRIGDFNLLTSQSVISHDCIVGNNNVFSSAMLCGHVVMGNDNNMGIRSTIIPHVSVGNRNLIQAGMVVDKNVADDTIVFHRFKEKVIALPK